MSYDALSLVQVAATYVGTLAYPTNPTKAEHLAGARICSAVALIVSDPGRYGAAPAGSTSPSQVA